MHILEFTYWKKIHILEWKWKPWKPNRKPIGPAEITIQRNGSVILEDKVYSILLYLTLCCVVLWFFSFNEIKKFSVKSNQITSNSSRFDFHTNTKQSNIITKSIAIGGESAPPILSFPAMVPAVKSFPFDLCPLPIITVAASELTNSDCCCCCCW